jgi:hypothetical protein
MQGQNPAFGTIVDIFATIGFNFGHATFFAEQGTLDDNSFSCSADVS